MSNKPQQKTARQPLSLIPIFKKSIKIIVGKNILQKFKLGLILDH